jgi:hypothetical protein
MALRHERWGDFSVSWLIVERLHCFGDIDSSPIQSIILQAKLQLVYQAKSSHPLLKQV